MNSLVKTAIASAIGGIIAFIIIEKVVKKEIVQ